ncbi:GNAT family N-acetyltransferase [Acidisoma cladoniae]|uniref:GNAT family N-acetyltransferase n=1 Tax=Acidisoma cladoniae TaxID=3040935 RepID=UPI00254A732B|nr:GNAT family N-acetyltransferase [Acidisoma sp. PAMC 29798]
MTAHILDHPIWNALTTRQSGFAEADGLARRYRPEISLFAAIADRTPDSFASLRRLIPDGGTVALFTIAPVTPPDDFEVTLATTLEQMLGTELVEADESALSPLGVADAPEMLDLAELTKPGPYYLRTHELGAFLGVRVGGQLVAMAGERMRLNGFTEVTAVCTHPDHCGKGYGSLLLGAVARRVRARGETPFLHVFSHNTQAIALYLRSGFTHRQTMQLTVLAKRSVPTSV